jgi:transcriptional regulator with XRE-family HTH domain
MQLAAGTKVSQGHISDIEKGRRIGTPATLRAVATALSVPVDLLID